MKAATVDRPVTETLKNSAGKEYRVTRYICADCGIKITVEGPGHDKWSLPVRCTRCEHGT